MKPMRFEAERSSVHGAGFVIRWPWATMNELVCPGSLVVRRSKAEIAGVATEPTGANSTRMPGIETNPVVAVACTDAG